MTYATLAAARTAGAVGTDAEVTAALAVADALVLRYTGGVFAPTPMVVVARVTDGVVHLRVRVQTVTSVTPVGSALPMPASAYRVLSSETPGQIDAILLGGWGTYDVTVLGAEPWNGGFRNLYAGFEQVQVAGVFGWATTPPEVVDAAAALAAWRTQGGSLLPAATGDATPPAADDEGNALSITLDTTQPVLTARTTGLAAADALLAGYVTTALRVN